MQEPECLAGIVLSHSAGAWVGQSPGFERVGKVPSAFPEHGGQCTASDVTFRVRDSRPGCWVPEGQEEKGQGEGRGASSLAQPSSLPRGSPALGTCPPCVPIGAATVRRAGPMAGLLSYLEA